jgi:SAM-dependent methyltransferase
MIHCPSCNAQSANFDAGCKQCGFVPVRLDGFVAWAPELARNNDGFPVESFEDLAHLEEGHFWFRTRNALIIWALRQYFSGFHSMLEIGCGTGFVLSGIAKAFPETKVFGSEIYTAGLHFAAARLPSIELFQMDARKLPYDAEFDVVAAFDVIEHIKEDELVLQNLYRAVKPGGGCLITVPQHAWLWSPVDEAACHQRRYSRNDLHAKVKAAGFAIVRSTSFVTLLLPLMLASRLASKRSGQAGGNETMVLNDALDRTLEKIMQIEFKLIKYGASLPLGGSRLLVLKKG